MYRKRTLALLLVLLVSTISFAEKPRIAIGHFSYDDDSTKKLAEMFADEIEEELIKTKLVSVVERDQIAQIAQEHKIQLSGITDQATTEKMGKLLNVQKIVLGKINHVGSTITFRVKAIAIETGETFFSKSVSVDIEDEVSKNDIAKEGNKMIQDLIYEITGERVEISEPQRAQVKNLTIILLDASNVFSADLSGDSDTFAEVFVGETYLNSTSVVMNNANPVWNQSFTYPNYQGQQIKIVFYDKDLTKNEYIGMYILSKPSSGEYPILIKKNDGQLYSRGKFRVNFLVQ